jgi:hypothetical protein
MINRHQDEKNWPRCKMVWWLAEETQPRHFQGKAFGFPAKPWSFRPYPSREGSHLSFFLRVETLV